jgi:hypothetical protein
MNGTASEVLTGEVVVLKRGLLFEKIAADTDSVDKTGASALGDHLLGLL